MTCACFSNIQEIPGLSPAPAGQISSRGGPTGGDRSPLLDRKQRFRDRFPPADGTASGPGRPIPLPEHERAPRALRRGDHESSPQPGNAFPDVGEVPVHLLLRDAGPRGELPRRERTFPEERYDAPSNRFVPLRRSGLPVSSACHLPFPSGGPASDFSSISWCGSNRCILS